MLIRQLVKMKLGQPIRSAEEVHRLNELHGGKKGTPTMGGILLIGAVIVSTLLWARPDNAFVWICLLTVLLHGAIGFYDDWLKITKKSSDGISSRMKFLLQCILAGNHGVLPSHPLLAKQAQELYIPFLKGPVLHLGLWTYLFYLLIIVGSSNAVNLNRRTRRPRRRVHGDGRGMLRGLHLPRGEHRNGGLPPDPLLIPLRGTRHREPLACRGGARFPLVELPSGQGLHGRHRIARHRWSARVLAICCKQELLLAIVGGVFVAEALSVILQVASFKLTGKRIFKMSPLHHHFELSGWKENTVTVRFWIMAIVFGLLGIATLKLR